MFLAGGVCGISAAEQGGVVLTARPLRHVAGLARLAENQFPPSVPPDASGPEALLQSDTSLTVIVLSDAEVVEEEAWLPGQGGRKIHYRWIPVGGAVVSIAPLANSVVAVRPVFLRVSRPHRTVAPREEDLSFAVVAFVERARHRAAELQDVSLLDRPRWEVGHVRITSKKARAALGNAVGELERLVGLAAGDQIGTSGYPVAPSTALANEVARAAILRFGALYSVSDDEIERFSVAYEPPQVRLSVEVDGFATVVRTGTKTSARAYKAWATATAGEDRMEASAVVIDELVVGHQEDQGVRPSFVRRAILDAAHCAVGGLLDAEVLESCET